jgi:hypothetical protein
MAINFVADQTVINSQVKQVHTKVCKLTYANFTVTTATNALIATLPADATILGFTYWNKTKLAGASISAAALSLGSTSGGTEFVSAFDVFTTVGTQAILSPVLAIMQPYAVPQGSDIKIYAKGLSTTGTPTSGEIYITIEYVR